MSCTKMGKQCMCHGTAVITEYDQHVLAYLYSKTTIIMNDSF